MTERFKGLLVTFETDVREDDLDVFINAIKLMKRVIAVKPIPSRNIDNEIAEDRVRRDLHQKLLRVIYPEHYKDE